MGLFDFFKQEDINQGIEEYGSTAGAILLDVRIPQEYQEGHIPESKNIPLQQLNNIVSVVKNKDIPLFVYCYSGVRSRQATGMLQHMEYMKVKNIGGIAAYLKCIHLVSVCFYCDLVFFSRCEQALIQS